MTSLFDLSGKVAMVTGANTGIGQAIAVALAKNGADVVTVSRSGAAETASLIKDCGRQCIQLHADLSSTAPLAELVSSALDQAKKFQVRSM